MSGSDDTHEFRIYSVGGLFDPNTTFWGEGGIEYNFAADHHIIKIIWPRLTAAEIAAVDHGTLHFALFADDDQIILFLKLDEASGWQEMPYTIWLVHEDDRHVPDIPAPDIHAGIEIFLVQAETGRIAAMRFLTISPAMTTALLTAIRHQASQPFDRAGYDARLTHLQRMYPTPDAFVADTSLVRVRCTGGD